MSVPWRRPAGHGLPPLPVSDRADEIDVAVQANHAAMQEAAATQATVHNLSDRVRRIHAALVQEGSDNHFTERWERLWGAD